MLSFDNYVYLRRSLPTVGELRCVIYFKHRVDIGVDTAIEMIDRLKTYSEEYLSHNFKEEQPGPSDVSKAIDFAYTKLDAELYYSIWYSNTLTIVNRC